MKENYLKIIFELGGKTKTISNKQLSLSLNVAAGSVTEMVGKLVAEGLATHIPYAGISLTDKGIQYAEKLVRKHRIWEVFLTKKLGYNLSDVHPEAEQLEHATSERMLDALDEYLDYPTHCPHGGVIPSRDGEYQEDSHRVLAEIAPGKTVQIDRFIDNHELLVYLTDLGIKIGEQIKIEKTDGTDGQVEISSLNSGKRQKLSEKATHNIFVV